ncbi:hypothetical protein B0H67DRAFT_547543 [Lasiosphaeris hirsuta]|uniref:Glucose-methanol-choline oxidoreductase N-terminal domain-containing protein n=1 Tax=Lasiosphaeris hirsuta TaxID=260670 RepID=A0AA39ZPI3_9PEZI|nr:hypothetical protein B0H67DRAFT_547543 [Lasiosphaeris hirsuta]
MVPALLFALVAVLGSSCIAVASPVVDRAANTAYDYIVVGGGTAGSAVATRLSLGLPWASILLIEAGPSALGEDRINIPGRKGSTLGTVYDWNFTTTAQPGAKNRVFSVPRGKVLGGSSALNLMTWDRASAPEYDAWADLGNPGWDWPSMIAAMKKVETFTPSAHYHGSAGIGTSGPIKTVINRFIPAQQESWIPTLNGLGVPLNLESLGGNPLGVMYQPSNIDSAIYNRSYGANGYLTHAGSNLRVMAGTRVAKINLKKQSKKSQVATGVTLQDGTVIQAREEVVISAGSIQSPGLLELSGIGRRSTLDAAGISQVIDLPGVGENLQDHIRIQTSFQLKDNFTSFDILRYNTTFADEQLRLWRTGELSMYDYTGSGYTFMNWAAAGSNSSLLLSLARQAVGTSTSPVDRKKLGFLSNPAIPQLEVIFSDGYTGVKGYPAPGTPLYGKGFFSLIAAVMHPLSRGSVHIHSSNLTVPPTINPNYLSNEHDIQAAVEAVKYTRKIANTAPMSSLWTAEYEPGAAAVPETGNNDAQWRDFVLNTTLSIFHPVGTCAMLPRDQEGVVSPSLVVFGTENLRVVDASVMPVLVSGHVQTAVYGIAERAASIMVEDCNRRRGGGRLV